MLNTVANLTVPPFSFIAQGLGVQAMCSASTLLGFLTVAWPTAEFAGTCSACEEQVPECPPPQIW
jgi:acetyl-CoA carboxylase carboxyltransferase component